MSKNGFRKFWHHSLRSRTIPALGGLWQIGLSTVNPNKLIDFILYPPYIGTMTRDEVIIELKMACRKAGSQKLWAAENSMSAAHVSDVIMGRKVPSKKILDPLGLVRTFEYHRVGELEDHPF